MILQPFRSRRIALEPTPLQRFCTCSVSGPPSARTVRKAGATCIGFFIKCITQYGVHRGEFMDDLWGRAVFSIKGFHDWTGNIDLTFQTSTTADGGLVGRSYCRLTTPLFDDHSVDFIPRCPTVPPPLPLPSTLADIQCHHASLQTRSFAEEDTGVTAQRGRAACGKFFKARFHHTVSSSRRVANVTPPTAKLKLNHPPGK